VRGLGGGASGEFAGAEAAGAAEGPAADPFVVVVFGEGDDGSEQAESVGAFDGPECGASVFWSWVGEHGVESDDAEGAVGSVGFGFEEDAGGGGVSADAWREVVEEGVESGGGGSVGAERFDGGGADAGVVVVEERGGGASADGGLGVV